MEIFFIIFRIDIKFATEICQELGKEKFKFSGSLKHYPPEKSFEFPL